MKAKAMILLSPSLPQTIYGVPPGLAGMSVLATMVTAVGLAASGLVALLAPGMVAVMALALIYSYRVGMADPHIETVYSLSRAFWSRRHQRTLLAGQPTSLKVKEAGNGT